MKKMEEPTTTSNAESTSPDQMEEIHATETKGVMRPHPEEATDFRIPSEEGIPATDQEEGIPATDQPQEEEGTPATDQPTRKREMSAASITTSASSTPTVLKLKSGKEWTSEVMSCVYNLRWNVSSDTLLKRWSPATKKTHRVNIPSEVWRVLVHEHLC